VIRATGLQDSASAIPSSYHLPPYIGSQLGRLSLA